MLQLTPESRISLRFGLQSAVFKSQAILIETSGPNDPQNDLDH